MGISLLACFLRFWGPDPCRDNPKNSVAGIFNEDQKTPKKASDQYFLVKEIVCICGVRAPYIGGAVIRLAWVNLFWLAGRSVPTIYLPSPAPMRPQMKS
jgi:hypothetical protein